MFFFTIVATYLCVMCSSNSDKICTQSNFTKNRSAWGGRVPLGLTDDGHHIHIIQHSSNLYSMREGVKIDRTTKNFL